MRLPVNRSLPLIALVMVSACSLGSGGSKPAMVPPAPTNGPAADYPMVIGEPFMVGSVNYRPEDKLNYDAVGRASIGSAAGNAITLAHKTLPVPSYVELTSLDSGRTILARVDKRGPMANEHLVELSPGAAAQLGITSSNAPVRVRRVNPPEPERALLRTGQRAPERMETPKALVAVLMRKLDGAAAPAPAAPPEALPASVAAQPLLPKPSAMASNPANKAVAAASSRPALQPPVVAATKPVPKPAPAPSAPASAPKPAAVTHTTVPAAGQTAPAVSRAVPVAPSVFLVQAGAFSTKPRADGVAAALGGKVELEGKFFHVRIGPFQNRAEAQAALAKARAAGYKDARILNRR